MNPDHVYWDDWLLLAVQAAGLVALIIYVWKTWEMASATRTAAEASLRAVEESRNARLEALAPRIVLYFEGNEHLSAEIVIYNAGQGSAGDLTLQFEPPLASTQNPELLEFFSTTQSVVPPGYKIEQTFDTWPTYFASTLPRHYTVTARYRGLENGRAYESRHELSIEGIRHRLAAPDEPGLKKLKDAVDKVARNLKSLESAVSSGHHMALYRPDGRGGHGHRLIEMWEASEAVDSSEAFVPEWGAFLSVLQAEALLALAESARVGQDNDQSRALRRVATLVLSPHANAMGNTAWLDEVREAFAVLRDVYGGSRASSSNLFQSR